MVNGGAIVVTEFGKLGRDQSRPNGKKTLERVRTRERRVQLGEIEFIIYPS